VNEKTDEAMGIEIERKFLVLGLDWKAAVTSKRKIIQGYIAREDGTGVRIRIADEQAFLTIKGARTGNTRSEFEYPIPIKDGQEMLDELSRRPKIKKTRHLIPQSNHVWEVDVFKGKNRGLITAEIELSAEDEPFDRPDWIGEEISTDPRYTNPALMRKPFGEW
jgi:adenylate cyclase